MLFFLNFRVSGTCKHVGALLWHIEQQVRLGNNRTCTSKKQKWSVPSKKQSLHGPDALNNIGIKKPKPENILYSDVPAKRLHHDFDPRSPNDRFINRFGTSPEKHCLTAMPYHLFEGNLQN